MTRAPTLLFSLALALQGCAGARAGMTREAELRRQLDARALPVALDPAWATSLTLLAERGYPLVGKDRELAGQPSQGAIRDFLSRGFATRKVGEEGRSAATGLGEGRVRYQIFGSPAPGGSRVHFTRILEDPMEPSVRHEERDVAMELELWRRVDPAGAEQIEGTTATPPPARPPTPAAPPSPTAIPTPTTSAPPTQTATPLLEALSPLHDLVGTWEGKGEGRPGTSRVTWSFAPALRGRYLEMRGTAVYEPQPANPAGERHEEVSWFSFDKARGKVVWRQLHVEGFVNQYLLEAEKEGELTFVTEAIEGLPPGFRARQVLARPGPDELVTRYAIAAPGKDFETYSENQLRRVPAGPRR